MSPLQCGDIVVVTFPFTDLSRSKPRPALILSRDEVHKKEDDYTLLFISSVIPFKTESYEVVFDHQHPDFKESGLKKASVFKTNKVATLQRKLLKRRLGKLGPRIRTEIMTALRHAIMVD